MATNKNTHTTRRITSKFLDPWNSEEVAPRSVSVKNHGIGIISSGMKICVLVIGLFLLFGLRQYQDHYPAQGISISKLKGFSVFTSNGTLPFLQNCNDLQDITHTVFDSEEYSIMDDYDSFYVMTNMWITCNQSMGICGEDLNSVPASKCVNDTDCSNGKVLRNGNGPQTGTCNSQTGSCNVLAWCPVEAEIASSNQYPKVIAENFTVSIKNTVSYPTSSSNFTKSNIYGDVDLNHCNYDKDQSPGCPIFTIGQIVSMISPQQNFTDLSIRGAVIIFNIQWICNLDRHPAEDCVPVYSVTREDQANAGYSGYNSRFIKNDYVINGTQYRTLVKAYGIRVIVRVNGLGKAASLSSISTWLGTSLAYYGFVTTIMTFLLTYGYLNYCIDVQKWSQVERNNNCCCNRCDCSWAAFIKALLYFLSSGLCCCCIYISTCCRCCKLTCFTMDNTLIVISYVVHILWIAPFLAILAIPFVAVSFTAIILLAIPSLMVLCLSCCCKDAVQHNRKILINALLNYDIKHDTYAAKILKHNWDGIERYPNDNEAPTADNKAPTADNEHDLNIKTSDLPPTSVKPDHGDTKVPDHVVITFFPPEKNKNPDEGNTQL